jgi:hypothetical protein
MGGWVIFFSCMCSQNTFVRHWQLVTILVSLSRNRYYACTVIIILLFRSLIFSFPFTVIIFQINRASWSILPSGINGLRGAVHVSVFTRNNRSPARFPHTPSSSCNTRALPAILLFDGTSPTRTHKHRSHSRSRTRTHVFTHARRTASLRFLFKVVVPSTYLGPASTTRTRALLIDPPRPVSALRLLLLFPVVQQYTSFFPVFFSSFFFRVLTCVHAPTLLYRSCTTTVPHPKAQTFFLFIATTCRVMCTRARIVIFISCNVSSDVSHMIMFADRCHSLHCDVYCVYVYVYKEKERMNNLVTKF